MRKRPGGENEEKTWPRNIKKRKKPGGETSKRGKLKFLIFLALGAVVWIW